MKISLKVVQEGLENILCQLGATPDDAAITAEVLIEGDRRGYYQHGINRIFQIQEGVQAGSLNLKANPQILRDGSSFSVIDAQYGLGQSIGKKAMLSAISKARETGVGVIGVLNAGHIGILGYYTELAALENCIGIALTTSSPAVVIKGGNVKTFGTNPLAYSIPYAPHPLTADFATSKVSRGVIVNHKNLQKSIPNGWAVDGSGQDTTCPKQALEGGLKAMDGDVKGSLLSLLISVLAGNLLGGVSNPHVRGTRYMNEKPNKGDLFIALDVSQFTNPDDFQTSLQGLTQFIQDQNVDFRIPGQRSHENRSQRTEMIDVSKEIMDLISQYKECA